MQHATMKYLNIFTIHFIHKFYNTNIFLYVFDFMTKLFNT